MTKIEIKIETIVHATEDAEKIFESLDAILGVRKDQFSLNSATGHFENPIEIATAKFRKKDAKEIIKRLIDKIPREQLEDFREDIEQHVHDSTLFLRISKQDLVLGRVVLKETDSVKFKITTPVFNKKETVKVFSELLGIEQVD